MLKRTLDIVVAATVLILFSPVMLAVAAAIWFTMGRPILFRQVRPGCHENLFTVMKFRTMANDGPNPVRTDAERLTPLGRFLRKTSLDELPELFNVLKGDMSLVGPRPLLVCYLPYFTPRERLRFTVRPGLTGLAQVSGRNLLDWNRRLEMDAQYVERRSFWFDIKLLWQTVFVVLFGKGTVVDTGSIANMRNLDQERSAS